jgi:hypothetical protein
VSLDFYDLYQELKDCLTPQELFKFTDKICRLKLDGKLPKYQFDELYDQIFERFERRKQLEQNLANSEGVVVHDRQQSC